MFSNLNYLIQKKYFLLVFVMILQFMSAIFFAYDITHDLLFDNHSFSLAKKIHYGIELFATITLIMGGVIIFTKLSELIKQIGKLQRSLRKTSNQLYEQVLVAFKDWNLSPSETDVALLIVKGFSNKEIAKMRERNEGTIKAQSSKIYEKAKVKNRGEFVSLIIEDFAGIIDTNSPES